MYVIVNDRFKKFDYAGNRAEKSSKKHGIWLVIR